MFDLQSNTKKKKKERIGLVVKKIEMQRMGMFANEQKEQKYNRELTQRKVQIKYNIKI